MLRSCHVYSKSKLTWIISSTSPTSRETASTLRESEATQKAYGSLKFLLIISMYSVSHRIQGHNCQRSSTIHFCCSIGLYMQIQLPSYCVIGKRIQRYEFRLIINQILIRCILRKRVQFGLAEEEKGGERGGLCVSVYSHYFRGSVYSNYFRGSVYSNYFRGSVYSNSFALLLPQTLRRSCLLKLSAFLLRQTIYAFLTRKCLQLNRNESVTSKIHSRKAVRLLQDSEVLENFEVWSRQIKKFHNFIIVLHEFSPLGKGRLPTAGSRGPAPHCIVDKEKNWLTSSYLFQWKLSQCHALLLTACLLQHPVFVQMHG